MTSHVIAKPACTVQACHFTHFLVNFLWPHSGPPGARFIEPASTPGIYLRHCSQSVILCVWGGLGWEGAMQCVDKMALIDRLPADVPRLPAVALWADWNPPATHTTCTLRIESSRRSTVDICSWRRTRCTVTTAPNKSRINRPPVHGQYRPIPGWVTVFGM